MIRDYANLAANERTYLAWVRTGTAIIALGFVIEKFNLFMLMLAKTVEAAPHERLERLAGPLGRYAGVVFVFAGVAMIGLSTWRFLRTAQLLSDEEAHSSMTTRAGLVALSTTVLAVAAFSAWLAVG